MRLLFNNIKFTPRSITNATICVYGEPNDMLKAWLDHWKLTYHTEKSYSNILIPPDAPIYDMFEQPRTFKYVDGFSPNLNKHLHIGHLSNLVLAKAFQALRIGENFIAILGDTLQGNVSKYEALDAFKNHCANLMYRVDKKFYASEMQLNDPTLLIDGDGEYANTKIFDIAGDKVVGIKSDGSTTYFYQDVALAQQLQESTLYLTGLEQNNHFVLLNKLFPQVEHIGLGLVKYNGKKMSSSEGNVILFSDVYYAMLEKFKGHSLLAHNVLMSSILKYDPESEKNINTETIDNLKLSAGLYISYTMARMYSAGIDFTSATEYSEVTTKLKSLKAKVTLKPHILFEELVLMCEEINALYPHYRIEGNTENKKMFQTRTSDVVKAVNELGLTTVTKV